MDKIPGEVGTGGEGKGLVLGRGTGVIGLGTGEEPEVGGVGGFGVLTEGGVGVGICPGEVVGELMGGGEGMGIVTTGIVDWAIVVVGKLGVKEVCDADGGDAGKGVDKAGDVD